MKGRQWKRCCATIVSVLIAGMMGSAKAGPIELEVGLGDEPALGDVINALQNNGGQVNRDVIMVNYLLGLSPGGQNTIDGHIYTRSEHDFGALPTATADGAQMASGEGLNNVGGSVLVTLTSTFEYLLAAYDGPNGGAQVWYVGDLLAGDILDLPRYARPANPGDPDEGPLVEGNRYQMTGWTLMNPTSVPDGGLTLVLLGLAVAGLGAVRRLIG